MRIKIVKKAEGYFAPDRYESNVGQFIRVRKRNGVRGIGVIVAAGLSEDQSTVELSVDLEQ